MRTSQTILRDDNLNRRFESLIYPVINTAADTFIRTTSIERLDKLAAAFYGDSSLWWILATANGLGKGTYAIPRNTLLRIPSATSIRDAVININRNR
jgi:hypothetical protein